MKEPRSEVFNVDCVEYMRTLPDNYFDLAIADPPYSHQDEGMEIKGGRFHNGNRWNKYKKIDGIDIDCDGWDIAPPKVFFDELFRVSKNQIIWGANYFVGMPATRCFLVWKKNIPEQFSMAMCEYAWTSFNGNAKWIEVDQKSRPNDKRFHPTQKPIELYAWILRNFAKDGDLVFDPMAGSFSSRIACWKLGFDYVGCEIEKIYFDKGIERFEKMCNGVIKQSDGTEIKQLTLF